VPFAPAGGAQAAVAPAGDPQEAGHSWPLITELTDQMHRVRASCSLRWPPVSATRSGSSRPNCAACTRPASDPGPAVSPESNPPSAGSRVLVFVLAGAAIVILALFAGLTSLAMLAVGLAAAACEPGRRVLLPFPEGHMALAVARVLRPRAR